MNSHNNFDDSFDPVEWLRAHDPARDWGMPRSPSSVRRDTKAQEILAHIVKSTDPLDGGFKTRFQKGKRGLLIIIPIAILAALLTAAAYFGSRAADDPSQVACYADAQLSANTVVISSHSSPLEACALAWADPQFVAVFGEAPIPPLAVCVLDSGVAAVFPRTEPAICQKLGLPVWEEDSESRAVGQKFEDRLAARLAAECIEPSAAVQIGIDELNDAGLTEWEVILEVNDNDETMCASLAIDWQESKVFIVPIPSFFHLSNTGTK